MQTSIGMYEVTQHDEPKKLKSFLIYNFFHFILHLEKK